MAGEVTASLALLTVATALDIVCALLAVRLVRTLTRMQDDNARYGPVDAVDRPV